MNGSPEDSAVHPTHAYRLFRQNRKFRDAGTVARSERQRLEPDGTPAQRLLRERRPGWRLLVCDAARPVSVQRQMYELVKGTPNQVYVADGTRGGRHNYGVAVDVTLLDETGAPVDMGTPVDFFGDEAHTGDEPALAAEGRISAEACRNRQLLGSVMREAGLVPYRREWWHYEEPMAMSEVRTRYKLLDF